MNKNTENMPWIEKYRPKKLDDMEQIKSLCKYVYNRITTEHIRESLFHLVQAALDIKVVSMICILSQSSSESSMTYPNINCTSSQSDAPSQWNKIASYLLSTVDSSVMNACVDNSI